MLKKILFGILTILAVLAVCLCTLKLAHGQEKVIPIDGWTLAGKSVAWCGAVGHHNFLMKTYEEYGAKLKITNPAGETNDYYDESDHRSCEVLFVRHAEVYMIALAFTFETKEAFDTWNDLAQESADNFCLGIRSTHSLELLE